MLMSVTASITISIVPAFYIIRMSLHEFQLAIDKSERWLIEHGLRRVLTESDRAST